MTGPLGFSRYIYVVRGAGGLCLAFSFLCVFYSFKSISVKSPLSPLSFVDSPGSGEGGRGWWWKEERRWREGGGAVM